MAKESVIKKFTSLNGVGNAKAELLYTSGFDSIDKLKNATVEELKNINGITEKNAKDILSQLKETGKKETKLKTKAKPKETKKEKASVPAEEKPEEEPTKKIEETVEIIEDEEEGAYKVKKKPKLNKEQKEKLQIIRQIKKRTPTFLRE